MPCGHFPEPRDCAVRNGEVGGREGLLQEPGCCHSSNEQVKRALSARPSAPADITKDSNESEVGMVVQGEGPGRGGHGRFAQEKIRDKGKQFSKPLRRW